MREAGVVVAILLALAAISGVWVTPWQTLYYNGIWVTAIGFCLGIPTGVVYHVRLYRTLHPRGVLPPGWYWSPIRYNRLLQLAERSRVMFWCYAGAFGFAVICIGLILMGGGVSMALIRGV
ncbi:MAG: hypothetical protein AAGF92_16370 [Myxococcota bacterium]